MAPVPRLLAVTGASNVTGWVPPIDSIIASAHERGVPVVVDGAQLAPHRPLPVDADFVAFSGHKMYAPFGAGALIGPRDAFVDGDPFLAGGGAVELVDLDEVVWSPPPEREEAGSPNVLGAIALGAAARRAGSASAGERSAPTTPRSRARCATGLSSIAGVRLLGPRPDADTLPIASFLVGGVPHALVAARLSAEFGIGVRHGCFCAHPYLVRLLGLSHGELDRFRSAARRHDRHTLPGAVRASAGISTTVSDLARLVEAVAVDRRAPHPSAYECDPPTGDYWPVGLDRPDGALGPTAGCRRG